jgi:hypothetical protein|tara:strand:+ start:252 stop:512 length:261 start_codon:yes stop_codon:yes gene_type:complete
MSNTDILANISGFITIPTIDCNGKDDGYSIVCLEHIVSLDITEEGTTKGDGWSKVEPRGYIRVQLTSGKYLTAPRRMLHKILSRLA